MQTDYDFNKILSITEYSNLMFGWSKPRSASAASPKMAPLSLEDQVRAMKREALARARHAVAEGREAPAHAGKPGLSHYVRAMSRICSEHNMHLPARSILDLSGLTIEGFAFTSDDFAIAQTEINKIGMIRGHA
jgi:hypothetical protein